MDSEIGEIKMLLEDKEKKTEIIYVTKGWNTTSTSEFDVYYVPFDLNDILILQYQHAQDCRQDIKISGTDGPEFADFDKELCASIADMGPTKIGEVRFIHQQGTLHFWDEMYQSTDTPKDDDYAQIKQMPVPLSYRMLKIEAKAVQANSCSIRILRLRGK